MNHDLMKDALKRRRAHGLDLTIVLGNAPKDQMDDDDQKDGELAPEVEDKMDAKADDENQLEMGDAGDAVHHKLDHMLGEGSMGKHSFLKHKLPVKR